MLYVFGDFELDMSCSELRQAGQPLKLERQVFRVLAYLVQHHGQTGSKQELIEHTWTQAVASDWALARCIKLARQSLGDNGRRQRIINMLSSDGYCFVASVETR